MTRRIYTHGASVKELQGMVASTPNGRFVAVAKCLTCGVTAEYSNRTVTPPAVVVKSMEMRGWRLGKAMACAGCVAKERLEARAKRAGPPKPVEVLVTRKTEAPVDLPAEPTERDASWAASIAAVEVARTALPNGNTLAEVMCDQCAKVGQIEIAGAGTQGTVVRRFRLEGWQLGSGGTLCPEHRKLHRDDSTQGDDLPQGVELPAPPVTIREPQTPTIIFANPEKLTMPALTAATVSVPAYTPSATAAAKLVKRAAYDLIEAHFNVEDGQYSVGWNDARVSEESKLALPATVTLRIEMFGDLKVPNDLVALRGEVIKAKTTAMAAAGSAELAANDARKAAEACRDLEVKLANMAKVNGWLV
jgi:hypothetical protein